MVIAKVLGFETKELEYRESHAGANLIIAPELKDIGSVTAYIRMRATVLYAGVLAESLKGGKTNNDRALELISGIEGSNDHSKVKELVHVIAGIERGVRNHQDVLDEIDREVWSRAADLVEKYASQIDLLAKHWREALGGRSELTVSAQEIRTIACFNEIEAGCELQQAEPSASDLPKSTVKEDYVGSLGASERLR